jgi:CTP:molybdopterin cytidylyltransferase MocA
MSDKAGKAAIVTVHGTGDTAEGPAGEKWFQQGSPFAQRLLGHLRQHGVDADIVTHLWSGANSAWDRERGANKLASRIRGLYNKYDSIHVIGHSHGGNVANDAAVLLKWGLRRNAHREKFDSLTTVGTPFFNVRTGPMQTFAGILFMIIAWGSALLVPFLAAFAAYEVISGQSLTDDPDTSGSIAILVYFALVVPCLLFMMTMSRQGVRRILRPREGGKTRTSILSIWHEHDEAIAFLQRVEELRLEPFPRGALFRGSRAAAISFGVLAVLIIAFANPVMHALGLPMWNFSDDMQETAGDRTMMATVLGLLLAPAIFTFVYLIYRFIVGGLQEIAVRGAMNGYVAGVLRGVAMGRDGDQVLCNVAPRSHTHRTQELVLTGDCADRMMHGANGAAGKLIDKYRWALFSVGGDSSASLTSLTTDAMTWDSLIHTTYFDQPEVAVAVADHIARTVRESAHGEAPVPATSAEVTAPVAVVATAAAAVAETPEPAPAEVEAPMETEAEAPAEVAEAPVIVIEGEASAPVVEIAGTPGAAPLAGPTHEPPPPDAEPQPA